MTRTYRLLNPQRAVANTRIDLCWSSLIKKVSISKRVALIGTIFIVIATAYIIIRHPWNFHGNFPLASSLRDSVDDDRLPAILQCSPSFSPVVVASAIHLVVAGYNVFILRKRASWKKLALWASTKLLSGWRTTLSLSLSCSLFSRVYMAAASFLYLWRTIMRMHRDAKFLVDTGARVCICMCVCVYRRNPRTAEPGESEWNWDLPCFPWAHNATLNCHWSYPRNYLCGERTKSNFTRATRWSVRLFDEAGVIVSQKDAEEMKFPAERKEASACRASNFVLLIFDRILLSSRVFQINRASFLSNTYDGHYRRIIQFSKGKWRNCFSFPILFLLTLTSIFLNFNSTYFLWFPLRHSVTYLPISKNYLQINFNLRLL